MTVSNVWIVQEYYHSQCINMKIMKVGFEMGGIFFFPTFPLFFKTGLPTVFVWASFNKSVNSRKDSTLEMHRIWRPSWMFRSAEMLVEKGQRSHLSAGRFRRGAPVTDKPSFFFSTTQLPLILKEKMLGVSSASRPIKWIHAGQCMGLGLKGDSEKHYFLLFVFVFTTLNFI